VEGFEGMKAEFSDLRVWVAGEVAVVTRQYAIQAALRGRPIDASGNETMGWMKRNGEWKVIHIHYSHACPRPS
jgi:ketosteroid isomerase-like protein